MNVRKASLVAHYTVLEAVRTRVLHFGAAALAAWFVLALFIGELALTESARMRTAVFAGGARLLLVFVVSLHVAHSIAREYGDRTLELLLGRPISRREYYVGKFAGCVAIALVLATLASSATLGETRPTAAVAWGCGLALELVIVTALTLFAASSIGHLLPAMLVTLSFYLLARMSTSLLSLVHASTVIGDGPGMRLVVAFADLLVCVLPDLSRFAPTTALLGESANPMLAYAGSQTLLYCVILACAGMLDLQRKDL